MFCYNYGTNLNVDHRFCAKCGCRRRRTKDRDCLKYSSNEKDALTYYFYACYTYEAITKFLSNIMMLVEYKNPKKAFLRILFEKEG